MKKIFLLFVSISVFASCTSIQKELRNGDYDSAFDKALKRVKNNPGKDKYAVWLEAASDKAYTRDMKQIEYWKKEGEPSHLVDIYYLLNNIHNRHNAVEPITPLHINSKKRDAIFKNVADEDLIAAKTKAADFLYTHAVKIMASNNRYDARNAYDELLKAKEFFPGFRDVDAQIQNAYTKGISHVLLNVVNVSNAIMPAGLEKQLTSFDMIGLNSQWVKFDSKANEGTTYDYRVMVHLVKINASPEQVLKNKYTDTKKVEDGFEYLLDAKGNVKKDSLGNDMKTKKYKTIACDVLETNQQKDGLVGATVDFYTSQNELIYSYPISGMSHWQYFSAVAVGDLNALTDASRAKLAHTVPAPFISDEEIILMAGDQLKPYLKSAIENNRGLVK
ncbi:hypothetical protein LBMAG27_09690 [Bacteroidota bacterium]|nr:hypothetical protein LBMAG27_09690 [Bacteroidota bacterium]